MHRSWFVVVSSILLCAAGSITLAGFTLEAVEDHAGFQNTLALDSAQRPHICYGHFISPPAVTELRYAWLDVGGWMIETVLAQPGVYNPAYLPKLLIDPTDQPHLAYVARDGNGNTLGLRHGYRDANGWHFETIDPSTQVNDPSIAVNRAGRILVAYYKSSDLWLARRSAAGQWTLETVDSAGNVGAYACLDLDRNGNPCVTYFDYLNYSIKYARKNAGIWRTEFAVFDINLNGCSSLEVDALGNPHLSYTTTGTSKVAYAKKQGGLWVSEVVNSSINDFGVETSLELDSHGSPHIVYSDGADSDLLYSVKIGQSWYLFDVSTDSGYWHDFRLDANDLARISLDSEVENLSSVLLASGGVVAAGPESNPFQLSGAALRIAPNPARGALKIEWALPNEAPAALCVFDLTGRLVRDLLSVWSSERHHTTWDGRDARGASVPTGVYYLRLKSAQAEETQPVIWFE